MIQVKDIPFVAYPVTEKQRACDFYEGLLGLKQESGGNFPDGFWLEYAVGSATLALSNYWKPAAEPSMGPCVGLEVEDFDGAVARLMEKACPFRRRLWKRRFAISASSRIRTATRSSSTNASPATPDFP